MIIDVEFLFYLISSLILSWYFFMKINYEFFSIRGISLLYFVIFYPFVILLITIQAVIFQGSEIIDYIAIINTLKAYNVFIFIFIIVEFLTNSIKEPSIRNNLKFKVFKSMKSPNKSVNITISITHYIIFN